MKSFSLRLIICFSLMATLSACGQQEQKIISTVTKEIESPTYGDSSKKNTLLIFADYQCPACQSLHKAIDATLKKEYINTNKLTVVYKNYPLPGHKNAYADAHAGLCGHFQGKFPEMKEALYEKEIQIFGALLTEEERNKVAEKVGLEMNQYKQCMKEGWFVKRIEKDIAEGDALGIMGTPSLYLNGVLLQPKSLDEFLSLIKNGIK